MLITCHPTCIKIYLLGYPKGFLLFFKRYSQIIRNMITVKVLLRIIPLLLAPCEYQYMPFGCLCYYEITSPMLIIIDIQLWNSTSISIYMTFEPNFYFFFLPFFPDLFLTKSYIFAKLTLDIMAVEWSLKWWCRN